MRIERWISREAVVLVCLLGFGSPTMAGDPAPLPPVWIDYSSSGAAADFTTRAGFAGNDRIYSMELYQAGWRASIFGGGGTGLSSLAAPYRAADQRLFHALANDNVEYAGAAVDFSAAGAGWMLGSATIRAADAGHRTSWFGGLRNESIDLSLYRVNREDGVAARAADFAWRSPLGQVGLRHVSASSRTFLHTASFEKVVPGYGLFGLEFTQARSRRFNDFEDTRWVITFRGMLDSPPTPVVHADKSTTQGWGRPAVVAAAAVGVALLASSGLGDQDEQLRYASQHVAARQVLNGINPKSVAENREYGGWVYRNADATFSATEPKQGTVDAVNIGSPNSVPRGTVATASYHSHAAYDPRYDSEHFSPTDIAMDVAWGVDGYLATPVGTFKYHQYLTGLIFTLGTVAN